MFDMLIRLFPEEMLEHPERVYLFIYFKAFYLYYLGSVFRRRALLREVLTPRLVSTEISVHPENPMSLIRICGRRGGFLGWFFSQNGTGRTYEMHVSSKLVTLKTPGIFDEWHAVLPVNRINAVSCDYHVPFGHMIHFMAGGMVLCLWHGFSVVFFALFLGFVYAVICSSMRLCISTGEGFWGFRYVIGTADSKETVFRLLHTLRLLLVRTQDKIPMPLPPQPMVQQVDLAPPVHGPAPLSPAATSMTG